MREKEILRKMEVLGLEIHQNFCLETSIIPSPIDKRPSPATILSKPPPFH
jgi:hypothetical protein